MTFRLWTLNRALRLFGVTISVTSPSDKAYPTLVKMEWIGWGAKAVAASDRGRGPVSGHERDEENEQRYMRCVRAMDDAWDEAVGREYT
jgi:hypothetical protein